MPYQCKVSAVEFVEPPADLSSGTAVVRVKLEDGKQSVFTVATMDTPGRWLKEAKSPFRLGRPVLFVRSLQQQAVANAVNWMAADMGGFWLRYYNSEKRPAKGLS
ncbi:MAG: hypothetical protein HZB91_09440 [Elusimicrobia bacterium]|nr:hypothetical protein [Elusimicrobiota bacterium]